MKKLFLISLSISSLAAMELPQPPQRHTFSSEPQYQVQTQKETPEIPEGNTDIECGEIDCSKFLEFFDQTNAKPATFAPKWFLKGITTVKEKSPEEFSVLVRKLRIAFAEPQSDSDQKIVTLELMQDLLKLYVDHMTQKYLKKQVKDHEQENLIWKGKWGLAGSLVLNVLLPVGVAFITYYNQEVSV